MSAAGAGSRARSREIGYAEAMADISYLLEAESARWKNSAEQQIIPHAEAALKVAADQLRAIADYAHGVAQIRGTERAVPVGELMEIFWRPLPGEQVPAELPNSN